MKEIQMNRLVSSINENIKKQLVDGKINEITSENPLEWESSKGKFKYDGEDLYFLPTIPIESIKINMKIIKE